MQEEPLQLYQTVTTKSKKFSLFLTLREPSVKRKDLRALTLAGPLRVNTKLDPLAVLHLDNRLYMFRWGMLGMFITLHTHLNLHPHIIHLLGTLSLP